MMGLPLMVSMSPLQPTSSVVPSRVSKDIPATIASAHKADFRMWLFRRSGERTGHRWIRVGPGSTSSDKDLQMKLGCQRALWADGWTGHSASWEGVRSLFAPQQVKARTALASQPRVGMVLYSKHQVLDNRQDAQQRLAISMLVSVLPGKSRNIHESTKGLIKKRKKLLTCIKMQNVTEKETVANDSLELFTYFILPYFCSFTQRFTASRGQGWRSVRVGKTWPLPSYSLHSKQ